PAFQVSLFRVLHEHEFTPLGGLSTEKTDVRIIAATNQDLSQLLKNNQFRQDLYYRINVVRLFLPPLRQRMEDIPLLVERFIAKLNMHQKKFIQGIDKRVLQNLMAHDFPGNIRELENLIEHAFVLCSEGYIKPHHLPNFQSLPVDIDDEKIEGQKDDPLKTVQIRLITEALARNNYNRNAAAKDLGIHKSTLFRQIKKLGITL
ncbi:MAG: sigma 54-interacting transcriptional regulator, partial [Pseudomonadota bacterium]